MEIKEKRGRKPKQTEDTHVKILSTRDPANFDLTTVKFKTFYGLKSLFSP